MKPDVTCVVKTLKTLYPEIHSALTYKKPYEFVFSVILSAQTTDKQVNKVTDVLFKKYTTLESIAKSSVEEFAEDISSIGLYKMKAKNIVKTAQTLVQAKGVIPKTIDALTALPGIGRKTANVVLSELYGINEGVPVDTHVKRLAVKYGLSKGNTPEAIEKDLMKIIPQDQWGSFALRLIQYGRDHCSAGCKKCPSCPLWKCVT